MNIHEYQAKKILSEYGILVPKGAIAYTPNEAKNVAHKLSSGGPWILKAQIQSGNRNRGYFIEKKAGKGGGIRKIKSKRDIVPEAEKMLGSTLVTDQTGPKGKFVSKIYVEAYYQVKKIFYIGLAIDRELGAPVLLVADSKDEDVINVALKDSKKILRIYIDMQKGASTLQIEEVMRFLKLPIKSFKSLKNTVSAMHKVFTNYDATMVEISPVGVLKNNLLMALDSKISFDDNALYRHKNIKILQDDYEHNDSELQAKKYGFVYSEFNGNIGCIVNGDGVALAAMDLLSKKGFGTACFLNVKGGVDKDKIIAGIKIILTNPKVEGVLINVLGGFLRCNLVAEGIIAAASEVGLNVPLVVRFEGTNKLEAEEILERSHLPLVIAQDMESSVDLLIEKVKESE